MVSRIFSNAYSPIRNSARYLVKKFNWTFDTYKALTTIQDKVHIFTHIQDGLITQSCRLGEAVNNLNPHPETISNYLFKYSSSNGCDSRPHMVPLTSCRAENGSIAETKELLLSCFNQEAPAQAQVM
jgi:hypothetical protein